MILIVGLLIILCLSEKFTSDYVDLEYSNTSNLLVDQKESFFITYKMKIPQAMKGGNILFYFNDWQVSGAEILNFKGSFKLEFLSGYMLVSEKYKGYLPVDGQFMLTSFRTPLTPGTRNCFVKFSAFSDIPSVVSIFNLQITILPEPNQIKYELKGKTFELSEYNIDVTLHQLLDRTTQISFESPELITNSYSCTGSVVTTFCSRDNNKLYIHQFVQQTQITTSLALKITNINNPPTIGVYDNYKFQFLKSDGTIIIDRKGTLQVTQASEFDIFLIQSSNQLATQESTLTIQLQSKYYILPNSELQLSFSDSLTLKSVENGSINGNKVTISIANRINEPVLRISLKVINLNYQSSVQVTAAIYNGGNLSLQSTQNYKILANSYKNFQVSRTNDIVSYYITMSIHIQLHLPLNDGYIIIKFPSEFQLSDKLEQHLTGDSFNFEYQVKNPPTICATQPFQSFAYTQDKMLEYLTETITLTQSASKLNLNKLQLVNPYVGEYSNLIVDVDYNNQLYITLGNEFSYQRTAETNAIQNSEAQYKLDTKVAQVLINNIHLPRVTTPISIKFEIYEQKCLMSQTTEYITLKPSIIKINSSISEIQLSKATIWKFIFQTQYQILSTDSLIFTQPNDILLVNDLKCTITSPVNLAIDCKDKKITGFMASSGQSITLQIEGFSNPPVQLQLQWEFKLIDENNNIISTATAQYNKWNDNVLKYAYISLLDTTLSPIKEALLNLQLQFPITQLTLNTTTQLLSSPIFTISTNASTLTIPFRYYYNSSIFDFSVYTYNNDILMESGVFQQVIQLHCSSSCLTCSVTATNCTSCIDGYLSNNVCVAECPSSYYGHNGQCLPCLISYCVKCGMYEQQLEQCLECSSERILLNSTCILPVDLSDNITNSTTSVVQQKQNLSEIKSSVVYQFPGTLLAFCAISVITLICKIKNKHTVATSVFYPQLCLLEYSIGIVLFIYLFTLGLFSQAFLSISLIVTQLTQQTQTVIHLNSQLEIDPQYISFKKELWSIKLIHLVSMCFTFQFQIFLTSKITKKPQWNYGWSNKEAVLYKLTQSMKAIPLYSVFSLLILSATSLKLMQVYTFFIEVGVVNILSIILNLWHQYQFGKQSDSFTIFDQN